MPLCYATSTFCGSVLSSHVWHSRSTARHDTARGRTHSTESAADLVNLRLNTSTPLQEQYRR